MRLGCADDNEITPSVEQDQWHKCLTSNTVRVLGADWSSVLDFPAFCALRHKLAK